MIRRALLCLLAAALPAAAARAESLALTGATVHTVSGPVLENATIVIEEGRIAAVGADLTPVPNTRVVSCAGKHIYPGLVSANTVLGLTEVASVAGTNDFSETGTTNPNIRAEIGINPESDLLPVARVNGITTALVVPRGGAISGTSALVHLDGWTFEDMTVRAPIGLHVQWPNLTPVRGWFEVRSDEEQKKARDQALAGIRQAFDDARAYWTARAAEGKAGIPRHDRDVKWDAMGRALRGEIPVFFHAAALNQIKAALRFADEQKLTNVVLVGGGDAWRVADELKARNIAVVAGPTLALPRRGYEPYDEAFTGPAKLWQAGVRFCIGDGGSPFGAMNARNLAYHAAMAAAFGLPRDEALKSVTLYPAQILGVADMVGSIESGKLADLIVTDGDPLEITTRVEQVWSAGRPVSMETRQTGLFRKYDARPRGAQARGR
ncbi:MAG: amidohydrolase family protein [Candidatus Eisenbacteria bacterium]|nr:amidohydrolase family protein [Candidatus Eisenbacteria bacterium]